MSTPIIIRNEAGAVVAVQTEHVIAKRLSTGAIVWRPVDVRSNPLLDAARYRELHGALLVIAPAIEGHNLSHSPPDARTGYRTVTDLEKPTEDIAAILEGAPIFDHGLAVEGMRCDACQGPLTDLGAHGIGCAHCAAKEEGTFCEPVTRPTPMLPPPLFPFQQAIVDAAKGQEAIVVVKGARWGRATTLATLANVQADEMAHDIHANPSKRGKSRQSTDA